MRGWCEVTGSWEEEAGMLPHPTWTTLLWASPRPLTSSTSGMGPQVQALGIGQGDWGMSLWCIIWTA